MANAGLGYNYASGRAVMELSWLEDFEALAASGSFSRAAEQRHVTQPAFSRRIRALEEWTGTALFDRSAHPTALTEAGRRFRPVAEEVLRRLEAGRAEARAADAAANATLRFAATHVLSLTFFPEWLRGLEPLLELGPVQLVSDTLQAAEGLMLQGRAQFLLCHDHDRVARRLDAEHFLSVSIGGDTLLPVTALDGTGRPRFTLAGGGAPLLAYSAESGLGRILRALGGPAGSEPAFTSHLAIVLKSMVLQGRGIAWLPLSLIREDLKSGRLAPAGNPEWAVPVDIRLFRRRAKETAAAERLWRTVEIRPAGNHLENDIF